MEQYYPQFEWTFTSQDGSQRWTVRCDDFEDFEVAIQQVESLLPGGNVLQTSNSSAKRTQDNIPELVIGVFAHESGSRVSTF